MSSAFTSLKEAAVDYWKHSTGHFHRQPFQGMTPEYSSIDWEADCSTGRVGVAILTFDVYDGLPVQRLPLQRVGTQGEASLGDGTESQEAAANRTVLDGFEDLEAVLSPETAAASRSMQDEATQGAAVGTPKAGVTLLGGLVTAQSKVCHFPTS